MRYLRSAVSILSLVLILLLVQSCTGRKNPTPTRKPVDSVSVGVNAPPPAVDVVKMGTGSAATPAPSVPVIINKNISLTTFDSLLASRQAETSLPQDMKIGELMDSGQATDDEKAVAALARDFLEGLLSGKASIDSFPQAKRIPLTGALTDGAKIVSAEPTLYRLGKVKMDGDSGNVNVLLYRPASRAAGTLYVRREGDSLRLDDLSIPFEDLEKLDAEGSVPRFEPEEYSLTAR
jgi:hypothetical protein